MHRCGVLLAAGLARDALAEADTAIARLDLLRGQATRRAELLLTAARAALAAGDPATGRGTGARGRAVVRRAAARLVERAQQAPVPASAGWRRVPPRPAGPPRRATWLSG